MSLHLNMFENITQFIFAALGFFENFLLPKRITITLQSFRSYSFFNVLAEHREITTLGLLQLHARSTL